MFFTFLINYTFSTLLTLEVDLNVEVTSANTTIIPLTEDE